MKAGQNIVMSPYAQHQHAPQISFNKTEHASVDMDTCVWTSQTDTINSAVKLTIQINSMHLTQKLQIFFLNYILTRHFHILDFFFFFQSTIINITITPQPHGGKISLWHCVEMKLLLICSSVFSTEALLGKRTGEVSCPLQLRICSSNFLGWDGFTA